MLSASPDAFRRELEWLAASRIPVAPLSQIRRHPGAVALTFDDGSRNFAEAAWRLLFSDRRNPRCPSRGDRYSVLSQRSSQAMTLRYQKTLFCG